MTTSSSEQIQEPGLHTLQHDCATICLLNTYDPALSIYRQASIISLAHLTSWCAERIASATLRRLCPNPDGETTAGKEEEDITPENVWDLYMSWRKFAPLGTGRMEDIEECMRRVIHDFEFVTPQETEKKLGLSRTPRPVSSLYTSKDCHMNDASTDSEVQTSFPYTKLWFPSVCRLVALWIMSAPEKHILTRFRNDIHTQSSRHSSQKMALITTEHVSCKELTMQ